MSETPPVTHLLSSTITASPSTFIPTQNQTQTTTQQTQQTQPTNQSNASGSTATSPVTPNFKSRQVCPSVLYQHTFCYAQFCCFRHLNAPTAEDIKGQQQQTQKQSQQQTQTPLISSQSKQQQQQQHSFETLFQPINLPQNRHSVEPIVPCVKLQSSGFDLFCRSREPMHVIHLDPTANKTPVSFHEKGVLLSDTIARQNCQSFVTNDLIMMCPTVTTMTRREYRSYLAKLAVHKSTLLETQVHETLIQPNQTKAVNGLDQLARSVRLLDYRRTSILPLSIKLDTVNEQSL